MSVADASKLSSPAPRFEFLDGLRGIAALYVVIHHAAQIYMGEPAATPPVYFPFFKYLILGHYAVVIFLVMSGFCLMLPVARSSDGQLRGGIGNYFRRRARRILPPYYAAIALALLLVALVPSMRRHDGEFAAPHFPGADWQSIFEPGNLISHALVLHAFSPRWVNTIDSPLWSIGIEWIAYFLMPFVFLPIWRRFGNLALALGAMLVAFLPYATIPLARAMHQPPMTFTLHWAHPWFLGLFGLGMACAALRFPTHTPKSQRKLDDTLVRLACHPLTLLALGGLTYALRNKRVAVDVLLGGVTVCLILHCTHPTLLGRALVRLLESRVAMALGAISYSLYLIHAPLLILLHRQIEPLNLTAMGRFAYLMGLAVPACVLAAVAFYFCFERPFLSTHAKAATKAEFQRAHDKSPLPAPAAV